MKLDVNPDSISTAYDRIQNQIYKTPVLTCSTLDQMSQRQLYFKCENFQKTGSFKIRGALNAVSLLSEKNQDDIPAGVITHSCGNHGQAVAYAASQLGMPCHIVVPETASHVKIDAMKSYGARVTLCEPNLNSREQTCKKIMQAENLSLIHSCNDTNVINGQGTIALEFLERVPQLDAILVPIGGGSLLAGVSTWAKYAKPHCKIFGVEPEGKKLSRSLNLGFQTMENRSIFINTVADGLRIRNIGDACFNTLHHLGTSEIITMNDPEIIKATKLIYERMKIVVEPSSAICLAAALSKQFRNMSHDVKHVGIVLTGGNVNLDHLPWFGK